MNGGDGGYSDDSESHPLVHSAAAAAPSAAREGGKPKNANPNQTNEAVALSLPLPACSLTTALVFVFATVALGLIYLAPPGAPKRAKAEAWMLAVGSTSAWPTMRSVRTWCSMPCPRPAYEPPVDLRHYAGVENPSQPRHDL